MKTAKKICESDEQGVVHVDVPVGRPGQRVEVLVVWGDVGEAVNREGDRAGMAEVVGLLQEGDIERPPQDETARRARLERYTTWSEDDLREFQTGLAAQRVVDPKLWA